eukprot:scaffold85696_cov35-Attheya_sp.AAC.1
MAPPLQLYRITNFGLYNDLSSTGYPITIDYTNEDNLPAIYVQRATKNQKQNDTSYSALATNRTEPNCMTL